MRAGPLAQRGGNAAAAGLAAEEMHDGEIFCDVGVVLEFQEADRSSLRGPARDRHQMVDLLHQDPEFQDVDVPQAEQRGVALQVPDQRVRTIEAAPQLTIVAAERDASPSPLLPRRLSGIESPDPLVPHYERRQITEQRLDLIGPLDERFEYLDQRRGGVHPDPSRGRRGRRFRGPDFKYRPRSVGPPPGQGDGFYTGRASLNLLTSLRVPHYYWHSIESSASNDRQVRGSEPSSRTPQIPFGGKVR